MLRSYHLRAIVGDKNIRITTIREEPSQGLQELHGGKISGKFAVNCSCVKACEYYAIVLRRFVSAGWSESKNIVDQFTGLK